MNIFSQIKFCNYFFRNEVVDYFLGTQHKNYWEALAEYGKASSQKTKVEKIIKNFNHGETESEKEANFVAALVASIGTECAQQIYFQTKNDVVQYREGV